MSRRCPLWTLLCLGVAVAVAGLALTRQSVAVPSTTWMGVYAPEDIVGAGGLVRFLAGLRIPVPPNLAVLEIGAQNLFGSAGLVTVGIYRLCLIGSFVLALVLAYPSISRMAIAAAASLLFLQATVLIHPGNPQVYDPIFPALLLASLLLLELAARPRTHGRWRVASSLAAGFLLSMTELLRPFGVLLLLLWLPAAWARLRSQRALLIACAVPIVVFSGGWHAWQLVRHGQATISNHAGYNLMRSWVMVPWPRRAEEPDAPLRPGRWGNLNTVEHSRNSAMLTKHVLSYVIAHPRRSIVHVRGRVFQIIAGPTDLYDHRPRQKILTAYRFAVFCCSAGLFGSVLALLLASAIAPRRIPEILAAPGNIVLLTAGAMILLTAFGEYGEDARFLIAVLPFFACVPVARIPRHSVLSRALMVTGGVLIAAAVLLDAVSGSPLRFGANQTVLTIMGVTVLLYGLVARTRATDPVTSRPTSC